MNDRLNWTLCTFALAGYVIVIFPEVHQWVVSIVR